MRFGTETVERYIYVCMYICITFAKASFVHISVHICIYIHKYNICIARIHLSGESRAVCLHVSGGMYTHVYVYTYMYVHTCNYVYIYWYECVRSGL